MFLGTWFYLIMSILLLVGFMETIYEHVLMAVIVVVDLMFNFFDSIVPIFVTLELLWLMMTTYSS